MSRYRRVKTSVYSDAKFRRLSRPEPNGQTLWMYLLTAPESILIPGVVLAGRAALAESLGWEQEGFDKAFAEVSAEELAVADWDARLVWLPNGPAHNPPQAVNVLKAWAKAWAEVPECGLKDQIFQGLKDFIETMPKAFQKGFADAFSEGIGNTGSGTEAGTGTGTGTEADLQCATWIWEMIKKTLPDAKKPNLRAWSNVIRLMRERDRRTHEQIQALFAWAHNDSFWQSNILSPAKLREKWDRLALQAKSRGKPITQSTKRNYNQTDGIPRAGE